MIAGVADEKQPAPSIVPAPLILHVFSTFRVGGPQVRFADICRSMGMRFRHIVLAMDGGYDCAERIDPAVAIDYWRAFVPPSLLVKRLLHVRGLLRRHKPDVLVTYNWGAIEWALADRLPICPHIHIADGFGPEEASRQLWRRVWTRRVALGPGGCLLQYTYSPISPIPAKKLGVEAKLVRFVIRNVPPATVWRFRPLAGQGPSANGPASGRG